MSVRKIFGIVLLPLEICPPGECEDCRGKLVGSFVSGGCCLRLLPSGWGQGRRRRQRAIRRRNSSWWGDGDCSVWSRGATIGLAEGWLGDGGRPGDRLTVPVGGDDDGGVKVISGAMLGLDGRAVGYREKTPIPRSRRRLLRTARMFRGVLQEGRRLMGGQ